MALFFADLVREYSLSAGAGDFVLAGAVAGHRRFGDAVPAGARFHYGIAGVTHPEEWETGEGEIGSGGSLLRAPLVSSAGVVSGSGQIRLVDFAPGLKVVTLTVAAKWFDRQEAGVGIPDVAGLAAALAGKAAVGHDHEGVYAPVAHHHDDAYAAAGHGHGGLYAASGHDHDGAYAPMGHDHDDLYAAAGHDHDTVYQRRDAELEALAGLTGAADRMPYFTGPGAAALTALTPFGRSLVANGDAAGARANLGLGGAALKATGISGDAVPVLNGGAASWAAGATYGGALSALNLHGTVVVATGAPDLAGLPGGHHARLLTSGGGAYFQGWDNSSTVELPTAILGSVVSLRHDGTTRLITTATGIDVTGEVRCDALRIDAAPVAQAGASATHKLAVNLNGTIFHLLLSSS